MTLCRKTVVENEEEDILTKQYFPLAHSAERKELETVSVAVGANSSLVVERERGQQASGPWSFL
jgi:hypothetical protein